MKIIFHRYNSICEPDFLEAFRAVGLEILEDRLEMTEKKLPLEQRVELLGRQILEEHPLFVFSINFFPYISMVCEKLNCLYLCVNVDCPVVELYSQQVKNSCNRIFLFDRQQYFDIYPQNPKGVFHLPLGVNVARIDETLGAPDWEAMRRDREALVDNATSVGGNGARGTAILDDAVSAGGSRANSAVRPYYRYDVSLIGSLYREKNPYPEMAQKLTAYDRGVCEGLLAAQELFTGQQLLEASITDEMVAAIKKAAPDFYPSDLSFQNMDRFEAVNDYLSTELSVRDRQKLLTLCAFTCSTHLFTRSDTAPLCSQIQSFGGKIVKDCKLNEGAMGDPGLYIHGGVASLTEMPEVFRRSKINLNPTIRSIQKGLPQRIWDILGSGGFCLSSAQEEIPEYLEVGKHIEVYENFEEAVEKIRYYLTHEEERLEIARNGYELAKTKHTVLARVIEMIRTVTG